ncbi:hypothetical protein [Cellulosilyticum sp. I15G10I2]|uniref:hypothetical protein n=1 Tax=Cellulosilyticum sp. I15G10I2 TaxID=1892843 RepID=UPI00085CD744|nr:hypothetical protein [Cellulosilyticum sp. I15G10I2]
MNTIAKPRSLTCIILSVIIVFSCVSLSASAPDIIPPSPTKHQQTMEQFLGDIRSIHAQLFDIAQFSLEDPGLTLDELANAIAFINYDIERLYNDTTEYLKLFPSISVENTQVLLAITALNFIKNELYYLSLVIPAISDIERLQILNQYFRARLSAVDTLELLEEDLANY